MYDHLLLLRLTPVIFGKCILLAVHARRVIAQSQGHHVLPVSGQVTSTPLPTSIRPCTNAKFTGVVSLHALLRENVLSLFIDVLSGMSPTLGQQSLLNIQPVTKRQRLTLALIPRNVSRICASTYLVGIRSKVAPKRKTSIPASK